MPRLLSLHVSLVVLALAAAATAQQVSITALAAPPPTVSADVFWGTSEAFSFAPGPIVSPTSMRAYAWGQILPPGGYVWASLSVTPSPTGATVGAQVESDSTVGRSSSSGSFDVDVRGSMRGNLVITYSYSISRIQVRSDFLRVDVGGDGRLEVDVGGGFPASGSLTIPVTIAGLLRTKIQLSAEGVGRDPNMGPLHSQILVSVHFVPTDAVTFADGAPGCAGTATIPSLTGQDTRTATGHRLDFTIDHAFPNGNAALVFSTQPASIPIQLPPGCSFLVEPQVWLFLTTNATGSASVSASLPASLPAASLFMQALPFDFTPQAFGSNRLDVTLWP